MPVLGPAEKLETGKRSEMDGEPDNYSLKRHFSTRDLEKDEAPKLHWQFGTHQYIPI